MASAFVAQRQGEPLTQRGVRGRKVFRRQASGLQAFRVRSQRERACLPDTVLVSPARLKPDSPRETFFIV